MNRDGVDIFEWMEGSTLALIFQSAVWYSPLIQVVHLVSVAVFSGSLLVVDLRLLGHGADGDACAGRWPRMRSRGWWAG